ncbi:MAG: aldehyde dehydrogenase family protein [Planctomycetes bacterium]|nr:aldehyde dehydrogenase family protein [Planctomycetota bacterium]
MGISDMDQATLVEAVVKQVMAQLGKSGAASSPKTAAGAFGIYSDVNAAVEAATRSHRQLVAADLQTRRDICTMLREIPKKNAAEWGRIELEETKVGRLDHKIAKLELLVKIPGVEYLQTIAHSGDQGVSLDEFAPWGVIGCVTPVTHSIPTLTANAINMIAAGNSMVVNAHPSGYKCAAMAVQTYNRAIADRFGISDLICVIDPPTLRSAEEIFQHPDIPMLVVTGGPAVARAAMKQAKRAIVAGPGNPPVVIDETADLDNAAKSIIAGGGFDNNLLCIGEKEVFVVNSVFDAVMDAMSRNGAVRLNNGQVDRLTKAAFAWKDDHYAVQKELVGKGCAELAAAAGTSCGKNVDLLYGETDESNPFVPEEQMMPFVPFVRVRDVDEAIRLAVKHEHGFGHTAIIHSNNLANITKMGRACNTTIFVVNGPCTAGLGLGGEGYPSFSIATPTGEGITNPLTFTRFRRAAISGSLRVI